MAWYIQTMYWKIYLFEKKKKEKEKVKKVEKFCDFFCVYPNIFPYLNMFV